MVQSQGADNKNKTGPAQKTSAWNGNFIAGFASWLMPVLGRRKNPSGMMGPDGANFYELRSGWETEALMQDCDVRKVFHNFDLEQALTDKRVKTVFVPLSSTVSRPVARRLCRRYGEGKTVFFEVKNDE